MVDASGRAGRSIKWLVALGYDEPPTSVVTINRAYASRASGVTRTIGATRSSLW